MTKLIDHSVCLTNANVDINDHHTNISLVHNINWCKLLCAFDNWDYQSSGCECKSYDLYGFQSFLLTFVEWSGKSVGRLWITEGNDGAQLNKNEKKIMR